MIPFVLIGLPRSATAWLSVLLDAEHDPFGRLLPEQIDRGICCTGAYLMPAWLAEQRCPVAKIVRPSIECDASLRRIGLPETTPAMRALFIDAPGRIWRFSDLQDEARVRRLWEFLRSDPFDGRRYRRLRGMHIEVREPGRFDPDIARELIRRGLFAPQQNARPGRPAGYQGDLPCHGAPRLPQ